jgi:alpha-glucosidase
VLEDIDLSENLQFTAASKQELVKDKYESYNLKKTPVSYSANKKILHFKQGRVELDIIFQVSNDGVAFCYNVLPGNQWPRKVLRESTSYRFPANARGWLQPMSKARSGWESSNPAYEEHYLQGASLNTPSTFGAGWVYPALFNSNNTWVLITEGGLTRDYCGSRLQTAGNNEMQLTFPDSLEAFTGREWLPHINIPWYTPWRIIVVGELKTIIESTLGTDVGSHAPGLPALSASIDFAKPGHSSWSWIMSKDDYIVYDEQKKYIDFAADMHWEYCLIDADWDTKIGYEKIAELIAYARTKNVGICLWYNSSGNWNTTKYHPKSKLLTKEDRQKEFKRLQDMGVKGVKVDFFPGDGQSSIAYYIDILEDAAKYKLMVNFHGATLPRGWHRFYKHLITTEAVRGFEMVTFGQDDANKEATHCTILPFTRNAFDPMDFTPMNLYKIPTQSKRKTSSSFELALSVLFLSGIPHYAESPDGMAKVPAYVKQFLIDLPSYWDGVRFIDGFPGKDVILARKNKKSWYIAGINGEASEKTKILDLSFLKNKKLELITDGNEELSFTRSEITVPSNGKVEITMKPNGGFVMRVLSI